MMQAHIINVDPGVLLRSDFTELAKAAALDKPMFVHFKL